MASTLPVQACVKSNASLVKLLAPPPFLLLFLLLFLSLLSLLHINDLLTHSLSRPPPLLHSLFDNRLLLFDKQGLLSHLLHIQQHYLAFLLSPCPIFILANLIIFTLFLSVYFSSSASSSDFLPEKLNYGDASLPAHTLPNHDNFFLASTDPHQHFVLSQNPFEEYHVLSFDTNYESTYYRDVQSYDKPSKNWEKVKGVGLTPYTTSHIANGMLSPMVVREPGKFTMPEKVQSYMPVVAAMPTIVSTPPYEVLNVDQVKVVEKGLQENRLEEKRSRSTKVAGNSSPSNQAVVINMELALASRHTRMLTDTSMQASHPPLIPLASVPHPAKAAPLPPTKSNMLTQRPPTSPRVKKSLQSTGSFAKDGKYEASKPILDGEKPSKLQKKPSSMVRSNSGLRLSQLDLNTEVTTTVLTSPSCFTNKPHMQRAQSLRSSRVLDMSATNALTSSSNKAPMMRRTQSLRDKGTPHTPNSPSQGQVIRFSSFSASIDGLSNAEANKCFSDFIAHRFALMKKERE